MGQSTPCSTPIILVVDDEPFLRLMAVDLLEDAGFQVLEAANSAEAIAILERRDDVRLLFTDVNMPGVLDGAGLAKCVRKRWPAVEIIVTSGKMSAGDLALPDTSRFVSKPYDHKALVRMVRAMAA